MQEAGRMGWRTELWTSSDTRLMTESQRGAFDSVEQVDRYDFDAFAARELSADVVFVDEMYLPDTFYEAGRDFTDALPGAKLVAMDDMRQRSMGAVDLVINTELGLRSAAYEASESLLGERYCLIREGFENPIKKDWPENRGLIPVLVMVGGTDPFGCSSDVLEALRTMGDSSIAPVLICGDGKQAEALRFELSQFPEYRLEVGLDDLGMAGWIATCSMGVIGCSSSMYEFAALGTPFVGLSVADNQEISARKIESEWKLPVIRRSGEGLSQEALVSALRQVAASLDEGKSFAFGNVDLLGARRAMNAIAAL